MKPSSKGRQQLEITYTRILSAIAGDQGANEMVLVRTFNIFTRLAKRHSEKCSSEGVPAENVAKVFPAYVVH